MIPLLAKAGSMIGGIPTAVKVGLISAVIIGAMSWGFKMYYDHTEAKIAELNQQVVGERIRAESAEANLAAMQQDIAKQTRNLNDLNTKLSESRKRSQELAKLLAEHDLKYLASQKPGLIENRANRATAKVFDELEELSDPSSYDEVADE